MGLLGGGRRHRRSERPAQLIPRAAQCISNACRHCDRWRVAAGFYKLEVAHRDVGLLSERFLGQASGGAQAADVLAKFASRSSRHWTDSQRFKLFDPEGCFVFFITGEIATTPHFWLFDDTTPAKSSDLPEYYV